MSEQPKISNLSSDQKPQYTPLLFDWAPAPLAPKTGESSDFYTGAFTLVPKENGGKLDVVEQYNWTLSGPVARRLVPKVLITEYYQTLSSELLGYLYSVRGIVSNTIAGINQGVESTQAAVQAAGQALKSTPQPAQGLNTQIANTFATQKDKEIEVSTAAAQNVGRKDGLTSGPSVLKSALDPYKGLYTVKKTGFTYTFPYLASKSMVSVSNTWGDPGTEVATGLGSALGGASSILDTFGSGGQAEPTKGKGILNFIRRATGGGQIVGGLARAGAASGGGATGPNAEEKPKAFKGTDAVDTISITFYLYNTFDSDIRSIQRNWDLCFLLTYQNLPNRLAKNLLHPPCLYEIEVPGYKRIPLATLSKIDISNIGNVRIVDFETGNVVGGIQNSNCKVIPEAYKIDLEFASVLKNTRNTFLYTAVPESSINVTVEQPTT
jgi:hypothetical protein